MEPVQIDFLYGGNTETEGAKIEQSMDNIAGAAKKAQAEAKAAVKEQLSVIKQIEADIKSIESQVSKAAPGNAKSALIDELNGAKRALAEEKAALQDVNASIDKTAEGHVRLRTQVMEAKDALAKMEMSGKRGSAEYAAQARVLGELNDQMGDTTAQAKILADDEKGFGAVASAVSGVAGAMSAAVGVAALFGAENEDLMRIQTRLQAVMAITIGLQEVAQMLNKDSYFSVVILTKAKEMWAAAELRLATSIGVSTAAARAGMIAMTGGLIIAVIAVVAIIDHLITKQQEEAKAAKEFGDNVGKSASEPVAKVESLSQKWAALGDNMQAKKKFVDENKKSFEDLGVEVNNVADAENLLNTGKAAFIESCIAKAKAAAGMELAAESYKKAIAKMMEAEGMSATVDVYTSTGGQSITGGGTMTKATVKNRARTDAEAEAKALNEAGDKYIKQSNAESDKADALLEKSHIKKVNTIKTQKAAEVKAIYDANSEITKLILDINTQRNKLLLDQQADSLQKRLTAIEAEKTAEIRKISEKEADIIKLYNDNHKGEKGFVAKTSVGQIDAKKGAELTTAKTNVEAAYGAAGVAETKKYGEEITKLVSEFTDERTKIQTDYTAKAKVMTTEAAGLEAAALLPENEKIKQALLDRAALLTANANVVTTDGKQKESDATVKMIQDTELYKTLSDDKLLISKQTTDQLIADLKRRIEAEIAAGKLSKAEGAKMLAGLNKAQESASGNKNQNNPFAQLGSAISGNSTAQAAYKNAPVGTSTEELAKLESAAKSSTQAMATAAGVALAGTQAILGSVVGGLDKLGLLTAEQKKDADNVIGMVGGAANLAMGIASGNPMQIIQGSVDLIVNGMEYFDFKNKALEKSQKVHLANVKSLETQYKALQRAVDKALGTDVYKAQRDGIANNKRQIAEYQQWLADESKKAKRKQDADKIAETQQKIQDLKNNIADETQAITEALAQTNAKSLANELADAITGAFSSGEDAALAFGDVADQVMQNAVKNSLKLQFLEKPMQKAVNQLATDMESGGELTDTEQAAFRKKIEDAGKIYYEQLAQYSDLFTNEGGTQKGIQGNVKNMTEETGSALTGQIVAMRLNVVALLNNSKSSLDKIGAVLTTLEGIKTNTDRLNRIDETLYYMKQNGIKVQ